ncbi:SphA family protein [Mucilaginibacter jinjuensis]|uniref:Transporter n=1 Tax=Mucilaginibacter jinjuensis TaxID=1176721 RepID=A0ABY7T2F0_9SPHI|nr:transporter [Mucilaginibacter jinjuensis]WCT09998.1 transporter [Mucilaginibacter jinjuensis]
MKNKSTLSIITCLLLCISAQKGFSQLKGDRLLGGIGLDAGSQAPAETFSLLVPLYFYDASSLKNANGNKIAEPNFNMFITGVGGSYVSSLKILGANYGASVLLPFAQNRIQGNNVDSKSSFAYSDTYLQPFQLGWKTKVADVVFSYGMYIPTGKYEFGGSSNAGLGMFTNEFQTGTTLRLDPKGSISFSSLFSYEIHNDKKGTDIKPGDILSIEGGLGKTWYTFNGSKIPSSIIKAGAVYYMQFKTSNDELPAPAIITPYANSIYLPGKDHVYSAGLEGNILLTKSRMLFGLRWFDEFSAVNRFQGNTFFVTIAHVFSTASKKKAE